jgi:hypothetical protein
VLEVDIFVVAVLLVVDLDRVGAATGASTEQSFSA